MKKFLLFIYVLLTVVLASATFVEYFYGSLWVSENIYHSIPFILLWVVLTMGMLLSLWREKEKMRWQSQLLHLSFAVILMGALTSYMTSSKGLLHLREGASTNLFENADNQEVQMLPFQFSLDSFAISYYPGTETPSDYVSRVSIGGKNFTISMNNPLKYKGYRFYQSSFDEDGKGSWLSVNYDPWGTTITYCGYILLLLSICSLMFSAQGGFRKLLRHPLLKQGGLWIVLVLWSVGEVKAEQNLSDDLPFISEQMGDSLSTIQVVYHGRVVPYNTVAMDFVKKMTGKTTFGELTPEQFMESWRLSPQAWSYVPAIKIKSEILRHKLGVSGEYARMVDLMEEGDYKLRRLWKNEPKNGKESPLQKAILETDEKVALVMMLTQGTLYRPLPTDGSVQELSPLSISAELLYNRIPFSKILFMFNLTMGILSFVLLLFSYIRKRQVGGEGGAVPFIWRGFHFALCGALFFHASGYLLRWYIGGRIPLSNGFETMQFLALCILCFAVLFCRRFRPALPFGFLLSGFTLLVSYLGQMNPQITPLMPVLNSPWLSLHVSLIMVSYALFAFMLLDGILALCMPSEAERLMVVSRVMLYPAVFLLALGIFVGAVWANASWGRYWGWDPKEVWALITLLIYALPLHEKSLRYFRNPRFFHTYLVFAFLSVLMTYFGVNYLLGGMHSYA